MSEVKRYNANVFFPGCLGPASREVVLADDAEKLEAEAQALRGEVERGNRITIAMALDIAAVGEVLGIPGEQQEGGTGEFIDLIRELQEEVAALRARVVLVPDRYDLGEDDTKRMYRWGEGFNACIDELSRLNGKAVSEGLLRSSREAISEYAEGIRSLVRRVPGTDQRMAELDQCIADLSELLGEGKEHE